MIRKMISVSVLSSLLLASAAICAETPEGGAWLECMRQCDRDVAICYQGCNAMDDECWDYCWTRYWICLMSCGDIPDSIGDRDSAH